MTKSFLIILCLLSSQIVCFGQAENFHSKRNHIGLQLGFNTVFYKDSNYSPLNYDGNGLSLNLDYQNQKENFGNIFSVKMGGSINTIHSVASDYFETDQYNIILHFNYLIRTNKGNSAFQFYIGPAIKHDLNFLWFSKLSAPALSFMSATQLDLKVQAGLNIGKRHRLQASIAAPLFASVVRPPYNAINEAVGEDVFAYLIQWQPVSWDKYQAVEFHLDYALGLSKGLDFTIGYSLLVQKMDKLHHLEYANQQLKTGLNFKF